MKFDAKAAMARYKDAEVDELVRIAFVQSADFTQEAVYLAREELHGRGVDGPHHPLASHAAAALHEKNEAETTHAQLPANALVLILSFIFADLFAIVAALLYSSAGRKKATAQTWKAFGFGWAARLIVFGLFMIPWGK